MYITFVQTVFFASALNAEENKHTFVQMVHLGMNPWGLYFMSLALLVNLNFFLVFLEEEKKQLIKLQ